ncbi:hypothetical protein [Pseudogulbenkiania ferrooxidans]|uniref:Uncharacterized protein n=1 Tax=Pseudogulbenkiania ferrooxidans 2002 TaxID=279714 RepID=B9Z2Z5_9NEIS|nr:hypothetical protein [Pseudogulbenkiania ferrooxidans]EEG08948.1 conserved hypothetical protein [Pseudogulbenkiania ferrooxidans 2002]
MAPQQESPFAHHLQCEARKLRKKDASLTRLQALDQAARLNGFENWRHFTNSYQSPTVFYPGVIETSWRETPRQYWLERIDLKLQSNLIELFPPVNLRHDFWQGAWFDKEQGKIRVPTRFNGSEMDKNNPQSRARETIACIARHLVFLDATGLKPSFAWQTALVGIPQAARGLLCFDHQKVWRDKDGRYLITTEPYPENLRDNLEEFKTIAGKYNYEVVESRWPGMHNPSEFGTRLVLMAHKKRGANLRAILAKLDHLPASYLPDQLWQGKTTPM